MTSPGSSPLFATERGHSAGPAGPVWTCLTRGGEFCPVTKGSPPGCLDIGTGSGVSCTGAAADHRRVARRRTESASARARPLPSGSGAAPGARAAGDLRDRGQRARPARHGDQQGAGGRRAAAGRAVRGRAGGARDPPGDPASDQSWWQDTKSPPVKAKPKPTPTPTRKRTP